MKKLNRNVSIGIAGLFVAAASAVGACGSEDDTVTPGVDSGTDGTLADGGGADVVTNDGSPPGDAGSDGSLNHNPVPGDAGPCIMQPPTIPALRVIPVNAAGGSTFSP
jgi:hypothetical protein